LTVQARPTVLVVEDEALIAMDIESIVEGAGYRVIGSFSTVEKAFSLLEREKPDIAILDVNLGRSNVFVLADALTLAGTALLFVTGHSKVVITEAHKHRPLVSKPFLPDVLIEALKDLRGC
jgi:DNA-binding response OmpR family regulator